MHIFWSTSARLPVSRKHWILPACCRSVSELNWVSGFCGKASRFVERIINHTSGQTVSVTRQRTLNVALNLSFKATDMYIQVKCLVSWYSYMCLNSKNTPVCPLKYILNVDMFRDVHNYIFFQINKSTKDVSKDWYCIRSPHMTQTVFTRQI